MVMGLVSGLSLANISDSESFLVVHALFSQDACQREGFWEVRHVVSPFDLSRTLLVGGGVICSVFLSRTSCCKTTHASGYYGAWPGWAVSVSVLPLTVSGLRTLCLTLIKIKTPVLYLLCGVLSYCVTPISFPLLSQITLLILLVTKCVEVSPHNKQISVTPGGCPTT